MAREMTPQERAAALLDRIVGIIPMQPSQREARIEWLVEFAQATRRAALLEAANAMQKRYDESYDWSPLIENTIAELKRLAQEGS